MKTFYATRAFNDAGTEQAFAAGAPVTAIDGESEQAFAGRVANYVAGGLATDQPPALELTTATSIIEDEA